MYRVAEGCIHYLKHYDLEGTMAAFLHCPLNFDIKNIKELSTDSDKPFQRL